MLKTAVVWQSDERCVVKWGGVAKQNVSQSLLA